ncbi:MAG: glycogen debranching N-terminal domain-containing protein [Blastococcus sp.]
MAQPGRRLQPLLHDLVACVAAPTQTWSQVDGQVRAHGAQGFFHSDVRVLREAVLTIDGHEPEGIATSRRGAAEVRFIGLARRLGDATSDPTVRIERLRRVSAGSVEEELRVVSTASEVVTAVVEVGLSSDLAGLAQVKGGDVPPAAAPSREEAAVVWEGGGVGVRVDVGDADVTTDGTQVRLRWTVRVAPRETWRNRWGLHAHDAAAVVVAPITRPRWEDVVVAADDRRLATLVRTGLDDLSGLAMAPATEPAETFLAAGAPWFLTLFGRDSLWAARLLLPFGTGLAASTLRALSARQGRQTDPATAEAPGKVLHEVRRGSFHVDEGHGRSITLPPVYYGTVDATPLWLCLLHDAWRWGMPPGEVAALLPHAERALDWMTEYGDSDGDGFLEYVDEQGLGLANQGWKDSGDAVQWRAGGLARPPVALCEVQGYAYEAAISGAALLDAFGRPGADRWRAWAAGLAERFRAAFWVETPEGRHPAIALDGDGRPVDSLTSNIGHLLGTGILDVEEEATVVGHLTSPSMDAGFGLRTMAASMSGYAPLGYHLGTVWPHDTAIVVAGMVRAGHGAAAASLVEGLLAAGASFDGRLPELFAGDARGEVAHPVPYPAACRPQAWSAAGGAFLAPALLGLSADVPGGRLTVSPVAPSPVGALRVEGLRIAGAPLAVRTDAGGRLLEVVTDAPVDVVAPPEHR